MANFFKPLKVPSTTIVPIVSVVPSVPLKTQKGLYFLKKHIMVICFLNTCRGFDYAKQTI